MKKIRRKFRLAGSINLISNIIKKKPVVFHGEYQKAVKLLLSEKYLILLKPRVLWVDYRLLPIIYFLRALQLKPFLRNQLFFLQNANLNMFKKILESDEFFLLKNHDFSTLIINIPTDYSLSNDVKFRLIELTKNIQLIFFMTRLILPSSVIEEIPVELQNAIT